jgi:hypothetical protein
MVPSVDVVNPYYLAAIVDPVGYGAENQGGVGAVAIEEGTTSTTWNIVSPYHLAAVVDPRRVK